LKTDKRYKIVYCTPALYMAGGVEHVLTLKANYFTEIFGYDVTIILTEGRGKPCYYPLSQKVKVVHFDINFEELWNCSFVKKTILYLIKQHRFKKMLTSELMRIKPDITISLLRREINFLTKINDGSKKIGEIHVNRLNYRNFEINESNCFKFIFSKFWMNSLITQLKRLDKFVVLTQEDKLAWPEISNVDVIPDPLSFVPTEFSSLQHKTVIAVGRYAYQKGFDLLLRAWSFVEKECPNWSLQVFGQGDTQYYEMLKESLQIDASRCQLNGPTSDIEKAYLNSSLFVLSSRYEGFGMVLVEAMACGLPVISFDCPCGPKDIVCDKIDGVLVESGNVEKLAEAMIGLMRNHTACVKMANNGRKNVQRFKIDVIAERWKNLFDSLYI